MHRAYTYVHIYIYIYTCLVLSLPAVFSSLYPMDYSLPDSLFMRFSADENIGVIAMLSSRDLLDL